jgi:sortase B
MSERANGWVAATKVAKWVDKILDKVIALLLAVALIYGGFGLYDVWSVYHNAGIDAAIETYRPQLSDGTEHPSLSQLQALYPDVRAWLTVEGTNIYYPYMQGEDDMEYLNRGVDGEFNLGGSIFLTCENSPDFSDRYNLIYGHNMDGNVMFGELKYFVEDEYFQEHTTGWLFLPHATYQIDWFACIEVSAYDRQIYPVSFQEESWETSQARLDYIQQIATQYRDIGVIASDQLIALSTCSVETTDGRIVLIGYLHEAEEGVNELTE